jgi:hypothetical protein
MFKVDPSSCSNYLSTLLTVRTGVKVDVDDLVFSEIKIIGEEKRSAFIRYA